MPDLGSPVELWAHVLQQMTGKLEDAGWVAAALGVSLLVVAAGASDGGAERVALALALAGNPYSMAKTAYTAASRVTLFGSMATGADAGCPATANEFIIGLG